MARSNKSGRAAGARFERVLADYLTKHVSEFIDRRVKTGAKDKGDLANVRTRHGERVVVECKDVMTMALPAWLREADVERINDEALVGVVAHKRRGVSDPGQQVISMTVDNFIALLTGKRPDNAEES